MLYLLAFLCECAVKMSTSYLYRVNNCPQPHTCSLWLDSGDSDFYAALLTKPTHTQANLNTIFWDIKLSQILTVWPFCATIGDAISNDCICDRVATQLRLVGVCEVCAWGLGSQQLSIGCQTICGSLLRQVLDLILKN